MTHAFAFHGTIVKREGRDVTVSLFPGLILDVRAGDIEHIEEAEDPATGRTYVYIKLRDDADVRANFRPRLARLAAAAGQAAPFVLGGTDMGSGRHALPSGGAASIPPALDVSAIKTLAAVLPPKYASTLQAAMPRTVAELSTATNLGLTVWTTNTGSPAEPILVQDTETDWVNDDV
jgi:hypothetical protein